MLCWRCTAILLQGYRKYRRRSTRSDTESKVGNGATKTRKGDRSLRDLKLVKYLLLTDGSIMRSYLCQCDLHAENVYVNPNKPEEIVGIIDWQSVDLLPLFDHARQPYILDYDGPRAKESEHSALPENIQELASEEKHQSQSLYLLMPLSAFYNHLTHGKTKTLFRAMEFRNTLSFNLLLLAQNVLVDGEAQYQACVADLEAV